MGQILLAGEEPQERPALPGDVVADRPAKHWITGLERVEDRALGRRTFNPEFHLSVDACQSPQMFWEDHSDHGHASRSKSRTSKSRMRSKERAGNNFLIFKLAVRRGSPDPAVCWTVGLLPGLGLETFGRPSGKVRRPCHNLIARTAVSCKPRRFRSVHQDQRSGHETPRAVNHSEAVALAA